MEPCCEKCKEKDDWPNARSVWRRRTAIGGLRLWSFPRQRRALRIVLEKERADAMCCLQAEHRHMIAENAVWPQLGVASGSVRVDDRMA